MTDNGKKERASRILLALIPAALFGIALIVLSRLLQSVRLSDVKRSFAAIPALRQILAFVVVAIGYGFLALYDILALRHIGKNIPIKKTAEVSFISTAISYNIGMSLISGGSLRFRLYSRYGILPLEVAQIIPFCTLTFWIGFFSVIGLVFFVFGIPLPASMALHPLVPRGIGLLCIALVAFYLVLSTRGGTLRIRRFEFAMPSFKTALAQIIIGSGDWICAASVLYILIPREAHISYGQILGIFAAAQVLGITSNVPGGLGVFDSSILFLLSPALGSQATAGILLAFRLIYYIVPFILAMLDFVRFEVSARAEQLKRTRRTLAPGKSGIVPALVAGAVFAGGSILLISGAFSGGEYRFRYLAPTLFPALREISHLAASCSGSILLITAFGVWKRKFSSYRLSITLLSAGGGFAVLRGSGYGEPLIIFSILLFAVLNRQYFRRRTKTREPLSIEWIIAVSSIYIGFLWLGLFSYKHIDIRSILEFGQADAGSRYLRTAAVSFLVFAGAWVLRLIKAERLQNTFPSPADMERVKEILSDSEGTSGNLALLGDKHLLFSENGSAFLMYGVSGRSWIILGDPVGDRETGKELIWKLRSMSDRSLGWTVLYEVGSAYLPDYIDMGFTLLKIGEEAKIPLENFPSEKSDTDAFLQTMNHFESKGYSFSVLPSGDKEVFSLCDQVSAAWMKERGETEKGFSFGQCKAEYLAHFPVALVRRKGKPCAFANLWNDGKSRELSVDLMRYLPGLGDDVRDFLFLKLMQWAHKEGFKTFNLGMAPISGLEDANLAPGWNKLSSLIYQHGEVFYTHKGLRPYKEKFEPVWEPKFIALPIGANRYTVFMNIASLIEGK